MVFKKLHLGTAAYSSETFDEIQLNLKQYFNGLAADGAGSKHEAAKAAGGKRTRKTAVIGLGTIRVRFEGYMK